MIRALAADDPDGHGVRMSVLSQPDGVTRPNEILRIIGDDRGVHHFRWAELTLDAMTEPTLQVPEEAARALYEALSRYFQGAESTRVLPVLTGGDT